MQNKLLFLTLIIINFSLLITNSQPWSMFRGDQSLNGIVKEEFPKDIDILWSYKTQDEIKASPVISDNKIVVGSTDGIVYCLNLHGKLLWKFETGTGIEGTALVLDGNVYVGNLYGTLYSLKLENGEKNWEYLAENQFSGAPNFWKGSGKTYILIGSYDYYLHCVDANSGKNVWKYESNNFINGAVSINNNKAIRNRVEC